jgi:hypothetical protein
MQGLSLRSKALGIASVIALLAVGITLARPAADAGAATFATCTTSSLAVRTGMTTTAMGTVAEELGFVNRGEKTCSLRGYPHIQMLNASGKPLKTTDHTAPGAFGIEVTTVNLAPGATAYFGLVYHNQTGFAKLTCPTSAALSISPPHSAVAITLRGSDARIEAFSGTIVRLVCGVLRVTAVTAKSFQ